MSTGDSQDIQTRLARYLPVRWFGTIADAFLIPFTNAILAGMAACLSYLYSLYAYAKLQTRIKTATDGWLDMISADFFGTALPRQPGQSDDSYRAAIIAQLYATKATRPAMQGMLLSLTGINPRIIEPRRPADTGAYRESATLAYGLAGAYGSMLLPYQAFITVYLPNSPLALANVAGYGIVTGGYSTPSRASYVDLAEASSNLTAETVYSAIAANKPEGTVSWVQLAAEPGTPAPSSGLVLGGFILNDYNTLA